VNPGKQEGGGAKKIKNRRVIFSRYLAANDVSTRDEGTGARGGRVPFVYALGRTLVARVVRGRQLG